MTQNYLPKDAAEYPKASAARTYMVETANRYADGYAEQMKSLSKDDRMQKKALAIQKHMAEHCGTFAAMGFNQATWKDQIARRENILRNHTEVLTPYLDTIETLPEDEKFAFILYAHTNWFLHNAFIDKHIGNLNTAKEAGKPETAFDDRIILGTVYAICREWRAWWKENGSADFDTWTYEDSPWEDH
ncbi:MAG: hypothetical protein IJX93_12320 [Clostridia bacterium]|nr:hypothetical protein [Clostridia bacterium]MBQ8334546.1 hypothetical protein [Clostridia bacterium]MBQ8370005.1 hypothetical protein [Clostridia bacterium]MBQ8512293.1 hypothetical protein [Clostridia bacterium]